ncbi:MAG TPA: hypothetical protein VD905_16215 [Flavobacteriales bacterium]|nr:hypothetical protein [Flavobacteriales bacterium]
MNGYNYDNVYPLGKFVIYNPTTKKTINALDMTEGGKIWIDMSKTIKDHYVLKKNAGFEFSVNYSRLAGVSTNTQKQQYIKYTVSIDTMQLQHWNSNVSEMEFLNEKASKGELDFLKNTFESDPNNKLYFISSCLKIKDFNVLYQTHDSLASLTTANLDLPNAARLSIRGNVLYTLHEGSSNIDKTHIYYTGFGVRDYSDFFSDLLVNSNINNKIQHAKEVVSKHEQTVKDQFTDLRTLESNQ